MNTVNNFPATEQPRSPVGTEAPEEESGDLGLLMALLIPVVISIGGYAVLYYFFGVS